MRSILINGMHGLGDNIYSRAVLRQYQSRFERIWLTTPWPQLWHDMPSLLLCNPNSNLRTQRKNASRDDLIFETAPPNVQTVRLWYFSSDIRNGKWNSLPNAMLGNMGCTIPGDYRLPIPDAWLTKARRALPATDKPILIYRPLTFRPEWRASAARNPDTRAFVDIFRAIRDRFFVVSIADVDGQNEFMVSEDVHADLSYHHGEASVETLAGLFKLASCVYAAPGFALALAQAVETPSIIVFGGHESSRAYRASATHAPCLMIDPMFPCDCFNEQHVCDKRIDIERARFEAVAWINRLLQPTTTATSSIANTLMPASII